MRNGTSFRTQVHFSDYLSLRDRGGATFRRHLRAIGGVIDEWRCAVICRDDRLPSAESVRELRVLEP